MTMIPINVVVEEDDFDVQQQQNWLTAVGPHVGAVVSFVGLVRDINNNQGVSAMTLEHYPGMTEQTITAICQQAAERWTLHSISVIHRVGDLLPSDQIVYVGVSSRHRGMAFEACEFIMDFLKTDAPFWKKEQTSDGASWVDARESDRSASERWASDK
ncbi:Molybdopterin synthase catalytic subunit [Sinobacterium norvegicum]|uniref:Molybdopterin synthase catalytic subunit n=1 Tax=Sinobacterium norvegicum TaxID=1641715 RepID=A0ABM9AAG4_9GAMM|nr:molybdopterin synthase catalytic subunit MoaE [Sinobacterium norvegicum]CAH0990184.1 Molybdopterin synthase catalytic subunit [Sinobacterium norvegicum]